MIAKAGFAQSQSNQVYRVLSAGGLTLGKFDEIDQAMKAYKNWAQAVAVVKGDRVVIKCAKGEEKR